MQPRGKVKQLIAAMEAQPEKALWSPADCEEILGAGVSASLAPAVRRGWLHKHPGEGRSVFYSLQPAANDDEVEQPQEEFRAAHWSDGDLDLYGLIELEDGGWRMTPEMVAKVKRLLAWSPTA